MMKAKKVLTSTLAAVMAATTVIVMATVTTNAACSNWTKIDVVSIACDQTSGWCYPWDSRHSFFSTYLCERYCGDTGTQVREITHQVVKTGCC